MIYVKKEIGDMTLDIPVYGDEFYCKCPGCGKEVHIDEEILADVLDYDFGSSVYCKECSSKKNK